ncbi:PREDICTED: uncharacterized protein LOC109229805 [Nicotiana attenuata]|uniref:uncharacterized protein LOC109222046 n=1 Tax=Nicotiana attenuata TaxID=49451 RepID=UPI000904EDA9|nr:PREDICTED: uncharacterized protein LOC109222046 [Nicotiana attenuata]XP_019250903.1 PREDICTED: uncharacterized protein LOC109229805 [Nicotiana attenuata]
MVCISTVSYSIIVNGKPIKPFEAKRGLRQGDPLSPLLFVIAMEYLCRLMKQLGNNKEFRFHPRCAKVRLIQLGFADDLLLFCKGDVQSVMALHKQFQIFFTASGLVANTSKSSVYFGGVDSRTRLKIMEVLGYTKGDLPFGYLGVPLSTKRLSAIQCEPLIDKMLNRIQCWTAKFLSYAGRATLIKNNNIWDTKPKNASWVIQKIFKAKAQFQEAGYSEDDVRYNDSFSTRKMYKALQGEFQKVTWRCLVCNNKGMPKWIFILRLAIQDRLATKKRLARWGSVDETLCTMCHMNNETVQHLFFDCDYSNEIWQKLLSWKGVMRRKKQWKEEVQWAEKNAAGKNAGAEIYRMVLAAAVNHIWQARNNIIFQEKQINAQSIVKTIVQEIHIRAQHYKKTGYLSK